MANRVVCTLSGILYVVRLTFGSFTRPGPSPDLTDSELDHILRLARRVGRALSTAVKAEGLLIYQNNGAASLQEVPHYHLHLVPQWNSATPQGKFPPHIARSEGIRWEKVTPTWLTPEQTGSITARIRANLEFST